MSGGHPGHDYVHVDGIEDLTKHRNMIVNLCDYIREGFNGDCGCHLIAPEETPCLVCEAEAFLKTPCSR